MSIVLTVLLTVQLLTALGMIGLILVQQGKGADMGAAFGSGASGSLFGATGSANFLSRTTAVLAAVFFVSTLALAYFGSAQPRSSSSVLEGSAQPAAPATPAAQIPGSTSQGSGTVPAPAAPTAPGAGQIPAK